MYIRFGKMKQIVIFGLSIISLFIQAGNYIVVTTADSGPGSLREAINTCNANGMSATINFNIPKNDPGFNSSEGVWKIVLMQSLPALIANNVIIDGSSQTLNQGNTNISGPEIMINGNKNSVENAFSIMNASAITIKGFIINEFLYGIQVYGNNAKFNRICGNYIGVNYNASASAGNYNAIGGVTIGERNITSGNMAYGIDVFGGGCQGNLIRGNYIGTDSSGSHAIPNTYGILFDDRSNNNLVGGTVPGSGNLISGNTAFGAYFYNNGTNTNFLVGNLIGTDATGHLAIPNESGVWIDGATFMNVIDSNIISGNHACGITIFASYTDNNLITRNKIGTDISGLNPLGNGLDGIRISQGPRYNLIGGTVSTANTIACNGKNGIAIEADGSDFNRISCNSIYKNKNLGIDLFPEGVTLNGQLTGNSGPNDNQYYPVIVSKTPMNETGKFLITGFMEGINPDSISIEIFKTDFNDAGIGQGKQFLGTIIPSGNGIWIDTLTLDPSDSIIATATFRVISAMFPTGYVGNTSEFTPMIKKNTGIIDLTFNSQGIIFPNPARSSDNIKMTSVINHFSSIDIIDLKGNTILSERFENNTVIIIPGNILTRGIYLCVFHYSGNSSSFVRKLIINN